LHKRERDEETPALEAEFNITIDRKRRAGVKLNQQPVEEPTPQKLTAFSTIIAFKHAKAEQQVEPQ
jgi:hypothetical protein